MLARASTDRKARSEVASVVQVQRLVNAALEPGLEPGRAKASSGSKGSKRPNRPFLDFASAPVRTDRREVPSSRTVRQHRTPRRRKSIVAEARPHRQLDSREAGEEEERRLDVSGGRSVSNFLSHENDRTQRRAQRQKLSTLLSRLDLEIRLPVPAGVGRPCVGPDKKDPTGKGSPRTSAQRRDRHGRRRVHSRRTGGHILRRLRRKDRAGLRKSHSPSRMDHIAGSRCRLDPLLLPVNPVVRTTFVRRNEDRLGPFLPAKARRWIDRALHNHSRILVEDSGLKTRKLHRTETREPTSESCAKEEESAEERRTDRMSFDTTSRDRRLPPEAGTGRLHTGPSNRIRPRANRLEAPPRFRIHRHGGHSRTAGRNSVVRSCSLAPRRLLPGVRLRAKVASSDPRCRSSWLGRRGSPGSTVDRTALDSGLAWAGPGSRSLLQSSSRFRTRVDLVPATVHLPGIARRSRTGSGTTADHPVRVRDSTRVPPPRRRCSCCAVVAGRTRLAAGRRTSSDLDSIPLLLDQVQDHSSYECRV